MNIIDLGAIDRLVKRNTNLLTAFKVIDEIESVKVVDNIHKNIVQFDICDVVVQNDVIDLISAGGTIPISYYFADRYPKGDLKRILVEVRKFCDNKKVNFTEWGKI